MKHSLSETLIPIAMLFIVLSVLSVWSSVSEVNHITQKTSTATSVYCTLHLRGGVKLISAEKPAVRTAPTTNTRKCAARGYQNIYKGTSNPGAKGASACQKKRKVLRGKDGWKASRQARTDRERARGAHVDEGRGIEPRNPASKDWASARKQLKQERKLGAELRDLVPVGQDSFSDETVARLERKGIHPKLERLRRAYPSLANDEESDEQPRSKRRSKAKAQTFGGPFPAGGRLGQDRDQTKDDLELSGIWQADVYPDSDSEDDLSSFAGF